jgi:dUTP pyrophosphatase
MTDLLLLSYKRLHPDAHLPTQAYGSPVGWDVYAHLISETNHTIQLVLPPGGSRIIGTGLVLLPPEGYFLAVCSRSGPAAATPSIFVANSPGIIDPDYTGELKIILFNGGHSSVYIKDFDPIAQLILFPTPPRVTLSAITEVPPTTRGDRGFGSSIGKA